MKWIIAFFLLGTWTLSSGGFVFEVQAIDNKKTIIELANETLEHGSKVKEVLKADDESHENELVIDDTEEPGNIINRTIKFIATVVGTLGVFALVCGGYFMIMASGDEQMLGKGKSILMYTIAGLVVTFAAYVIVQYVLSIIYTI